MSNLHKDLSDIQLHVPKGFSNASNGTKLTKNATGALEWATDSGGGGGVTQIVAGTDISISPSGGTGAVTINSTATGGVSQIIAGTNVTISPSGGTGNVTINATGSSTDKVNETTKGYLTQGERPSSNWFLQSITSGANFNFDTRQTGTTISFANPLEGIGATFMGALRGGNIGSLSGIITATNATQCVMSLFLMRPDCGGNLLRNGIEVGTTSISVTAGGAHCFTISPSAPTFIAGDQFCIGLKTNSNGTTSFTGSLEIAY